MKFIKCDICGNEIDYTTKEKREKEFKVSNNAYVNIQTRLILLDKDICENCYDRIEIEAIMEYLQILFNKLKKEKNYDKKQI